MNRGLRHDAIRNACRRAPDRNGCDPDVVPSDLDLVLARKRLYTRQQRRHSSAMVVNKIVSSIPK